MATVSVQNLKVDFGGKVLFENVSFDVNPGEFVGLIGANGTGKTTLFKVITGEIEPTEGGAFVGRNVKVGYLEQHACHGSVRTVYDEALSVFEHLMETERELEDIAAAIDANEGGQDKLIEMQHRLNEQFQEQDGLTFRSRTRSALMGLGFSEDDFYLTCDKLSGGQRSKLSMCKLLLSGSDLLLLDEPTNHLDIAGTEWLENYLSAFKGTIIVISHDRYFLDRVTNKTVEITNKKSYCTKGNYSAYLKLKEERLESERRQYENQMAEIKRIEGIIEQQRSFARERNFITAESKRKMLEKKKAELIVPDPPLSAMRMKFTPACETGNDVLNVSSLSKAFGSKRLFCNADMQVYKNDRVFVLGTNGCGKTTLLRILTRQQSADDGSFNFGANVKIGYFDQSLESLKGGKTVIDEIWDEHRLFTEKTVRSYLALFLFRGDDVFKSVDTLSGGEKAKLCLLKLMLSGANVLLLDEPTNHLDIPSREVLEAALSDFDGTIIAVSHDRYFINKLSTKIYRMTESGFEKFDGDYDAYAGIALAQAKEKPKKVEQKVNLYKLRKERDSEINKLKGKIKRAEEEIDRLDNEIAELNGLLSDPEVSADYEKVLKFTNQLKELTDTQIAAMDEWEHMSARLAELSEVDI
ncbi:MAG: ABC-F family ATP-binding cassette domain-containing protein [Ruminococcaceae bacterium]|nr:ABC-F family ATP-binding cassette domain-containing protein [Oscillospiraceae bacterium]